MKYMIVALLAVVVAVNARPDGGVPPFHPGLLHQYQNSAIDAASGFANGLHTFGGQNFGVSGGSNAYDRGQQESSVNTITNAHQKSSYDRGHSDHFGLGGSSFGSYDQTAAGFNKFGALNSLGSTAHG